MPSCLGTCNELAVARGENLTAFLAIFAGNRIALRVREAAMELLILLGFAGVVIVLGFLSCLAGGTSEGNHMRDRRADEPRAKWPTRR
jgi:hypothetical protein